MTKKLTLAALIHVAWMSFLLLEHDIRSYFE